MIPTKYQPQILSIVRIVTAYAFFLHGTAKAFGFPVDNTSYIQSWASPTGIAAILEIVGGILLFVGLGTRPVAFILSGLMAVAYFMMHASIYPLANGGEAAMLFSFIFLYLSVAGGGAWSLDNYLNRK